MSRLEVTAFVLGFLDLFAVSMIIPQIAINFRNKGYSPFVYGLAGTTYGSLQTISGPTFGGYSDVYGRRKCTLLAFYLSGIVYLWLSLVESIHLFFIARAALGLVKHTQTMLKAYLCDMTPRDEHTRILGYFHAISSAGFIVGPLIGAHIRSFENGCAIAGLIFITAALSAHLLLPNSVHVVEKSDMKRKHESIVALFRSIDWPQYWDLFSGRLVLATAVGLYKSNLSYMLMLMYSLSTKEIGYITSLMGLVAAASGFLVGPIFTRFNRDSCYILVICSSILSVSFVLLYVSSNLIHIVVLLIAFQLFSSLARAFGVDAVLSRGAASGIGTLHGALQSVSSVSRGVTPILGGILQNVHMELPTLVSAALALVGSIIFLYASVLNDNKRGLKTD
ncbi:major facilitator superfamily domain-containing protein 9-like [Varroa jacobsoni]|uniref:major facilitator superfamily domain-containing protein 9-like n=1 Tax=Varroa jacobsoni TaxID=62625 RepID=UPI000BF82E71|nr:major facilitator superfamily domain-containing protein 9-like [Varroa jacobsoni]XP_022692326.1 major facilitator superfamily domain-containing protein 9-like [Varroa jacobsoni]XP_022692327.1 major facilitator superfamily domain-containing protein 9-like [Varroa jacobsoni]